MVTILHCQKSNVSNSVSEMSAGTLHPHSLYSHLVMVRTHWHWNSMENPSSSLQQHLHHHTRTQSHLTMKHYSRKALHSGCWRCITIPNLLINQQQQVLIRYKYRSNECAKKVCSEGYNYSDRVQQRRSIRNSHTTANYSNPDMDTTNSNQTEQMTDAMGTERKRLRIYTPSPQPDNTKFLRTEQASNTIGLRPRQTFTLSTQHTIQNPKHEARNESNYHTAIIKG